MSKTKWQFSVVSRNDRGTWASDGGSRATRELAEMLERIEGEGHRVFIGNLAEEITALLDKYREQPKEHTTVEEAIEASATDDKRSALFVIARRLDALTAEVRAMKEQAT